MIMQHALRLLSVPLVIAALMMPEAMAAQWAWPDSGARVRIHAPRQELRNAVGTFVNAQQDSVRVLFPGAWGLQATHLNDVRRLDVSLGDGYGANAMSGLMIGAVAGVGLGFAAAAIGDGGDEGESPMIPLLGGGAAVGAVLGLAIGLIVPGERWERLQLPR